MPGSVLIVDDHPRFRATARRALELDGWTVVGEAADGAHALSEAERLTPDLVLLDVGLPDVSGLTVADQLRGRVDVVLVSTHDAGDFAELAAAHGAKGFLAKADLSGPALDDLVGR